MNRSDRRSRYFYIFTFYKMKPENNRLFASDFRSKEESQRIYDTESVQSSFGEKMASLEADRRKVLETIESVPVSGAEVRTFQD